MLKINLSDVFRDVSNQISLSADPNELGLISDGSVDFLDAWAVHAQALEVGDEVEMFGQVSGNIRLQCVRCLDWFKNSISADWELKVPSSEIYADVGEELREQILLSLPVKPLCRSNCPGVKPKNNPDIQIKISE